MGSPDAFAYLASPEVVAASALSGKISSPGYYRKPEGSPGVTCGEGHGSIGEGTRMMTAAEALERVIGQLESNIETAEKDVLPAEAPSTTEEAQVPIIPGFPGEIRGEIIFLDSDNINTGRSPQVITFDSSFPAEGSTHWVNPHFLGHNNSI